MLPFQDANSYDEYEDMENYIETQTKILQSETLALQTIKSLDLGQIPGIRRESGRRSLGHRPGGIGKRPAILGAFLGTPDRRRVPNSRLIEVQI